MATAPGAMLRLHRLTQHMCSSAEECIELPGSNDRDVSALLRSSPRVAGHLRWLKQKISLGQDMFLVGEAGPLRRWLALYFCESLGRDVEYVSLTRDTTEADLKQRREIVKGGSSVYVDQLVVKAALQGKILILEGLEKAERNVLPVLNNLLENREMVRL